MLPLMLLHVLMPRSNAHAGLSGHPSEGWEPQRVTQGANAYGSKLVLMTFVICFA